MLGRSDYTKKEIADGKARIDVLLASYQKVAKAASADPKAGAPLRAFETEFCRALLLTLDRLFVHRIRKVSGHDGNPLNELELLSDSLMNNDGVFRTNNVIKYVPEDSVLQFKAGDVIVVDAAR